MSKRTACYTFLLIILFFSVNNSAQALSISWKWNSLTGNTEYGSHTATSNPNIVSITRSIAALDIATARFVHEISGNSYQSEGVHKAVSEAISENYDDNSGNGTVYNSTEHTKEELALLFKQPNNDKFELDLDSIQVRSFWGVSIFLECNLNHDDCNPEDLSTYSERERITVFCEASVDFIEPGYNYPCQLVDNIGDYPN